MGARNLRNAVYRGGFVQGGTREEYLAETKKKKLGVPSRELVMCHQRGESIQRATCVGDRS